MSPICEVLRPGCVEYETAWNMQARLAEEIAGGRRPPALLLLEHPHTYTFGRRGRAENLLWPPEELARRGVSVHWVDRGGDVTYHGPGQLVGYPLIPLSTAGLHTGPDGRPRLPQADYVGYLRRLEESLILALERLGVQAGREPGMTGVWVRGVPEPLDPWPAKIAAIGVKVDARGVTRHGFALNLNTDPLYWQGIIGCGLHGYRTINLADLLAPLLPRAVVEEAVCAAFGEVFGYEMVDGKLEG